MEVKIDPRAEARLLHDDWGARAWRVKHMAPGWVVVMVDTDKPDKYHHGRAQFAAEQLLRFGVKADVRTFRGDGSHQRPWMGWVTFAKLRDDFGPVWG